MRQPALLHGRPFRDLAARGHVVPAFAALAQAARHLDLAFTRVGDPGLRNLMSPGGPLNTLVLAQPIANIYVTGTFTAACVAQLMAERPGVVVRLVSA